MWRAAKRRMCLKWWPGSKSGMPASSQQNLTESMVAKLQLWDMTKTVMRCSLHQNPQFYPALHCRGQCGQIHGLLIAGRSFI